MAETPQKQKHLEETAEKQQDKSEDLADSSFSQHYLDDDIDSDDQEFENSYLARLKEQRRRIEDLSLHLKNSKERYEEERQRCRDLEFQLEKYQGDKVSSYRYEEITVQMQSVQEENQRYRNQTQQLKRRLNEVVGDQTAKFQAQSNLFNSQLNKYEGRINKLKEDLAEKQEQLQKIKKELKFKTKQYDELNAETNVRVSKVKNEYEERLKVQRKNFQKQEQEKTMHTNIVDQLEEQLSEALKENERLKEDNFKFSKVLQEKEGELQRQAERYKTKLTGLKKDLNDKKKEYEELRTNYAKVERQRREQNSSKEEFKVQITKISEDFHNTLARKQQEFLVEKRNLKNTIDEQGRAIGELLDLKKQYWARIQELQAKIQHMESKAKHRRHMLKDELKEIQKLEKVVDKIVSE